jgi:hypothetical protein
MTYIVIVDVLVKQAKRSYMNRFLESSLFSKILWRNLDTIGIKDADDWVNDLCLNRLNTYFAGNTAWTSVRPAVGSNSYSSSLGGLNASFPFSNVTPQDVFKAINKI